MSDNRYQFKDLWLDGEKSYERKYFGNGPETTIEEECSRIIKKSVAFANRPINFNIERFIENIMPDMSGNFILFTSSGKVKMDIYCKNRKEYIRALSNLSEALEDLFVVPTIFSNKRNTDSALWRSCLFIDIDGDTIKKINLDLNADDKTIVDHLFKIYPKLSDCKPAFIIKSGHGLHIYWKTPVFDLRDSLIRENVKTATKGLIAHFKADVRCTDIPRVMRCPESWNCKKDEKIKTKIIYENIDEIHGISDFSIFDSDFEEYKQSKSKANKKTKTEAKKKTQKIFKIENFEKPAVSDFSEPEKIKNRTFSKKPLNLKPSARYSRVLRDLKIFHDLRDGKIEGCRENWVFVNSVYFAKMGKTAEDAKDYILPFFEDSEFFDEAERTIENYFENSKNYDFKNETIAEWFNFSEEEKSLMESFFDEEERKTRKREQNRKLSNKRRLQRGLLMKNKTEQLMFIERHPEMTNKELSEALKVSVRTIQNRKNEALRGGCKKWQTSIIYIIAIYINILRMTKKTSTENHFFKDFEKAFSNLVNFADIFAACEQISPQKTKEKPEECSSG